MARPILYLDVDGPLNPYPAKPERRPPGYETHRLKPESWVARHPGTPRAHVKPLRVWLNPGHGDRLRELSEHSDLAWATTWAEEANILIGPHIEKITRPTVWPWRLNGQILVEDAKPVYPGAATTYPRSPAVFWPRLSDTE
jgi:hypothetical protein